MALYQHPNMRDMTAENLRMIVTQRQQQRLLLAQETYQLRQAKLEQATTKENEKYTKLGDKLATRLAKIQSMLQDCERDINTMQVMSNNLGHYETELGDDWLTTTEETNAE